MIWVDLNSGSYGAEGYLLNAIRIVYNMTEIQHGWEKVECLLNGLFNRKEDKDGW